MSRERQVTPNGVRLSGKCSRPMVNALTVEGVSICYVPQWLGHRTVNTTMNVARNAASD